MMLPVNGSSFRAVLHSSVGAVWYFHIIIVIIAHLILAGLSIYQFKAFQQNVAQTAINGYYELIFLLCPGNMSSCGCVVIGIIAFLRTIGYCIGPYAVSLKDSSTVFFTFTHILEYICCDLELLTITSLVLCHLIMIARTSLKVFQNNFEFTIRTSHKYFIIFLHIFIGLIVVIFLLSILYIVRNRSRTYIYTILGLCHLIISISMLLLIWTDRLVPDPLLPISFSFYSTSSSSSVNLLTSTAAMESNIYYECHSGLPRCMTKISLNEYYIPQNGNLHQSDKNTSIHINDLEIVIEINEPLQPTHITPEPKRTLHKLDLHSSMSTISSTKAANVDGEQEGYSADSEEDEKVDLKYKMTDYNNHNCQQMEDKKAESFVNNEFNISSNGKFKYRQGMRQMIIAKEYSNLFHSGINFLHMVIITNLLLSSIHFYNGFGKYGAVFYDNNRTLYGWGLWLGVLSLYRFTQYVILITSLILFRNINSKIGDIRTKSKYVMCKESQNPRDSRPHRKSKKTKSIDNIEELQAVAGLGRYSCQTLGAKEVQNNNI